MVSRDIIQRLLAIINETRARLNTLESREVVLLTATQTLTNKTLTTPTIGNFTNAQHAHTGATSGGTISHGSLTDLTTGDPHTQYLLESVYDANTILKADADNTPIALTVGASTIVGRAATGTIAALNAAQVATIVQSSIDHGSIVGLADDDHTGYARLAGRSGGQTLIGGTAANDDLTLEGTSNATRTTSYVVLQPNGGNVGIGTVSPGSQLTIVSPWTTENGSVGGTPIFSISGNNNFNSSFVGGVQISPTIGTLGTNNLNLTAVEISSTFFANNSSTISNAYSLRVSATKSGGQTLTNAYSLYVDAPTGATNNYAAYFGGNIGIGTTSPGTRLSLDNAAVANAAFSINRSNSATGYANIRFDTGGLAKFYIGLDKDLTPNSDKFTIYDGSVGMTAMTITNGNVGIGTTSPGSQLTIVSPWTTANGSVGGTPIFSISGNNNFNSSFVGGVQISPTIGTLGTNNLNLTAVEISSTFFANNSSTISNAYSLRVSATKSGGQTLTNAYSLYVDAPTGATNNYAAYFGGNIGIGTASPDTRLDIDAGAIEFAEMIAPAAGAANTGRLFCRDNGSGKTQLCIIFSSGAIQVIATQL